METSRVLLTEESVKCASDAIFYMIKETVAKENNGCKSYPHRSMIMNAIIQGLNDLIGYVEKNPIDVTLRDTIKLFAFAIPHLIQEVERMREGGNEYCLEGKVLYKACINLIATMYPSKDFKNMPDIDTTCEILSGLAKDSNKKIAAYTYLKGIHESCKYL